MVNPSQQEYSAAALRYGWWRVNMLVDYFSDESNTRLKLEPVFLLILILAEAYTAGDTE
jgi:cellulose synthase (UDP-forming)